MLKNLPTSQTVLPVIVNEGYVFIDKTGFIETYEQGKSKVSLFLRPRRFGKTMFAELLKYYYDAALKEESSGIFRNTYIESHPTPRKSSYHAVKFDFSGVATNNGVPGTLNSFLENVIIGISDFFARYPDLIPHKIMETIPHDRKVNLKEYVTDYYCNKQQFPESSALLKKFLNYMGGFPRRIMVIIDEYDNFTNDILSRDAGAFAEIARKEGDVGKFYQVLRLFNQTGLIDRIFITGVLPITLDTSLSGFVYDKIHDDPKFNAMAGFTGEDVAELLRETVDFEKCRFSPDALRNEMKKRYDGYRFSGIARNSVYNPAMCLSFVSNLIRDEYQRLPLLQTESGNDIDFEKFSGYLSLVDAKELNSILARLDTDPENHSANEGYLGIPGLAGSLKITAQGSRLEARAGATLLYHLGFLTIMSTDEARKTVTGYQDGMTYLKIPNQYYRTLFSQYRLSRYPAVFSGISAEKWGIGELSRRNSIKCLSDMLQSIAGAFVKTSCSREGEDQLVLTVYVALTMLAGSSFELTREYSIRHNQEYVFSDGLSDDEYGEIDTEDVPREHPDRKSAPGQDSAASEESFEMALARIGLETADSRKRTVNIKKGRADLVALNTGCGPSYIFEFKYQRDTRSGQETRVKTIKALYDRAVKQLNFYVTDDRLSQIPDLHKYVIIFAYGKFILKEV